MADDKTKEYTSTSIKDLGSKPRAKRPAPISWRPPAEKHAEFEKRLKASGLSANAFITEAVFGRTRHRPAELRQQAQILAQCAEIKDRLHEIAISGATAGQPLNLEDITARLIEIRSALFVLMGRKP